MYRVKEIEGKFIAQVKKESSNNWESIDKEDVFTWAEGRYEVLYGAYDSLEKARQRIKEYKKSIEPKEEPIAKYHTEI